MFWFQNLAQFFIPYFVTCKFFALIKKEVGERFKSMLTGCHSNSWSLIVYQSSVFLHYDILCCILHEIDLLACVCVWITDDLEQERKHKLELQAEMEATLQDLSNL